MLLQRMGRQKSCLPLKAHINIPNSGRRTKLRIFAEFDQGLFFLLCFKILLLYTLFFYLLWKQASKLKVNIFTWHFGQVLIWVILLNLFTDVNFMMYAKP